MESKQKYAVKGAIDASILMRRAVDEEKKLFEKFQEWERYSKPAGKLVWKTAHAVQGIRFLMPSYMTFTLSSLGPANYVNFLLDFFAASSFSMNVLLLLLLCAFFVAVHDSMRFLLLLLLLFVFFSLLLLFLCVFFFGVVVIHRISLKYHVIFDAYVRGF